MLPPPAPTSAISIAGVRRRYPPPLLSRLPREIGPPTSKLARPPDLVLLDNGSLGSRAAHIEANDVRYAEPTCHCGGADHPSRRAGFDKLNRSATRSIRSHHTAIRLHRQQRRPYLERAEPSFKCGQIPVQCRHDIGIRYRRAGALKLTHLRQHLRRECQIQLWQALSD